MNFQSIAFVDGSQATASYVKQYRARIRGDMLPLRMSGVDAPILEEWKSAKNLLAKISSAAAPLVNGEALRLVNAHIWSLPPSRRVDWHDLPDTVRGFLPLLPSPGAMLFSGLEAASPPVGQLFMVNRTVPFAALNLGPVAAVWLVVDAEMPSRDPGRASG